MLIIHAELNEMIEELEKTCWPIKHRSSSELWDLSAEILTELSRRDKVSYRVRANPPHEVKLT